MEKPWIDTEDGRQALLELADMPSSLQVLNTLAAKELNLLRNQVLGMNINDPAKDRQLLVTKAQLDGATTVLNSIINAIKEAGNKKAK